MYSGLEHSTALCSEIINVSNNLHRVTTVKQPACHVHLHAAVTTDTLAGYPCLKD